MRKIIVILILPFVAIRYIPSFIFLMLMLLAWPYDLLDRLRVSLKINFKLYLLYRLYKKDKNRITLSAGEYMDLPRSFKHFKLWVRNGRR